MTESMVTRINLHEPEEVQYFTMKSQLDAHAADGSITSVLPHASGAQTVTGTPASDSRSSSARPRKQRSRHPMEKDPGGRTLGIPHEPFEGLKDQDGNSVPVGNAYHVYNAFIASSGSSTRRPSHSHRPALGAR